MSQRSVQGVVSTTDSKVFPSKRGTGNVTLYSFQLEGGNTWFRNGETPLSVAKGDKVEFVADGQKVDPNSIRVKPAVIQQAPSVSVGVANTSTTVPTTTATSQRPSAGSRDEYWANKEARDLAKEERYQAVNEPRMALSVGVDAAARLVDSALKHDAIGFGTAAKSKRNALLTAYVKEVALDLAAFIEDAPNQLKAYRESLSNVVEVVEDEKSSDSNE